LLLAKGLARPVALPFVTLYCSDAFPGKTSETRRKRGGLMASILMAPRGEKRNPRTKTLV
jgi:hypothetical protein